MTLEGPIRPEMFVGDILREYPAVREKIREFFGEQCLQCRSNRQETVTYTAWHRGLDPKRVCRELNSLLAEGKGKKSKRPSGPGKKPSRGSP